MCCSCTLIALFQKNMEGRIHFMQDHFFDGWEFIGAFAFFFFFVACYFLEVILILIEQWMIQKKSIRLASCDNWIMETFLMLQEMIKIPDILHSLLFTFCSLFFSMGFFIKLCFCLFDLFSAWKREREREGGLITHKP